MDKMKELYDLVLEHPWVSLYIAILVRFMLEGITPIVKYIFKK